MIIDALRPILPLAGWSEDRVRSVEIAGALDPILPTPFRITETGTAALAAVGLAAADLWEVRTGRHPVVGIYPSKNGRWNYLHGNFPHHRAATLKVLGVPVDPEAVAKAVAQW